MSYFLGVIFAALSSATFGLAPFFSIMLLNAGYGEFEVLFYRWGMAACCLAIFGIITKCNFRLKSSELKSILLLCLFRASTSLSLIIAYENIASGVASTIHFMYPLAVTIAMILFFKEKGSIITFGAIILSIIGAIMLISDNPDCTQGNKITGIIAATISVFTYGSYIVGVRKTKATNINSTVLTTYIMGIGAIVFGIAGLFTSGVRIETDPNIWLYIAGLALPATAISNITLVMAVKKIGPTLTSILGALEPFTAVAIGVLFLHEELTLNNVIGICLVTIAVTIAVIKNTHDRKS